MIQIEDISPGFEYVGVSAPMVRRVVRITNNIVYYRVPGMLTMAPLCMDIKTFAEWAVEMKQIPVR